MRHLAKTVFAGKTLATTHQPPATRSLPRALHTGEPHKAASTPAHLGLVWDRVSICLESYLRSLGAEARTSMAGVHAQSLLLALLLPVVGTSVPSTVVRINKAALNYMSDSGKVLLQRALNVTEQHFLNQSIDVLQSTRIEIRDVWVPRLHLKFLADFGLRFWATANFTTKVYCIPESLEMMMPAVLLGDLQVTQSSIGTPKISLSTCFSRFGQARVLEGNKSITPALMTMVQKDLKAVLSIKVCLSLSDFIQDINMHLGTLIGLNPVGPESQICYIMVNEPVITSDYISMDFSAAFFLLGNPITLPMDTTPFLLPSLEGTEAGMATVTLSQGLFDSILLLLQKAGSLNLDITGELKSDMNLLNTSVLSQLIPKVAQYFPKPQSVVLKVRLNDLPVIVLQTSNITVQLEPFVEVLATSSDSNFRSLFTLNMIANLNLQLFVSKEKVRGRISSLGDVALSVASSNVGPINMAQTNKLMSVVFEKPLLTHINALLGMGVALPRVVNLCYVNSEVFAREDYVIISTGLLYKP